MNIFLNMKGPLKRAFFVSIFLTISSCALFEASDNTSTKEVLISNDYADHLVSLGSDYLKTPGVKKISLSGRSKQYLEEVYWRIVRNNELLLKTENKPKFNIIRSKTPFYFSLPKSNFFFSTGLLEKYLRNEQMLKAMLTAETFKSVNLLYEKNTIVPVGYIKVEQILSLVKVDLKVKAEINEKSYTLMRRAGFDPSAYLVWLQAQNKNMLDFSLQHGTTRRMSREEFLYKNYLASKNNSFDGVDISSSSKEFYYFLREVKRK